ncbi:beta-galactosidase-like [Argiope bruennichi]|uniref:Beta-galactosidase n=1 Tax=Argiope bruennichi TaxID=94029 RepID=A0A8T0EPL6_ARGBR|nr:beta-galactosidase-like [Argiope bruennichi]KAF8777677.1 Beta-galactosidase like protein [Argiope bruennichi]
MNLYTLILCFLFVAKTVFTRSFTVDYKQNTFLKDGKPFRYMSGSIHYFRVPNQFWYDRLYKMKMAGLNAIQTYVEWNHHEPEPGEYNFKGDYDLPKFLKTAHDLGLVVILRSGPFIDAERDMGGLPYWLLRNNPDIKLRSFDPTYIKYVDRWYKILLPLIEPYLYNNGGPIITLQIENEYGSIGCDAQYKSHLRDLVRKTLKTDVVLFTTDGSSSSVLSCGKTDEVLSTIDFGTGVNVTYNFEMLRWTQASGPLVNSEFYPGWLDHWGQPHAQVSSESIVETLTDMLHANASVNVYMFHGGTSFGFTAGSNLGSTFQACPTSYDYDAPLSEAGDPTPKYYAMREAIGKFFPLPAGPVPQPAPKMKLPPITMKKYMSLWEFISKTSSSVFSTYPLSFEDLSHPFGFVLYETTVTFQTPDPAILTVKGIADRAHVYVNRVLQGILSREQKTESIPIKVLEGQKIEILVENQGRICSGYYINDRKGIFQNVTLGSQMLVNWTMTPIVMDSDSIEQIGGWKNNMKKENPVSVPSIYIGSFTISNKTKILDSFLRLDGWHKGVAFLNNFNLGRYWPIVGPQVTLYAPSIYFQASPTVNQITLIEFENSPCGNKDTCTVQFVDTPVVNGTTPLY